MGRGNKNEKTRYFILQTGHPSRSTSRDAAANSSLHTSMAKKAGLTVTLLPIADEMRQNNRQPVKQDICSQQVRVMDCRLRLLHRICSAGN